MADQPITGLPTKTASGVASTDKMLGIDSAEGYQILVRDVARYIIENCDVSTLAGAVQTPKAAIDALNSNTNSMKYAKSIGTGLTLDSLKTALGTEIASMQSTSVETIMFSFGGTYSPFSYATYIGTLKKQNSSGDAVLIVQTGSNNGNTVLGHGTGNSSWVFSNITNELSALNSKLTIEVVQGITTSSTGAGDTGISSGSYYITNPIITNVPDTYCETFIFSNHLYIKAINRITNEPLANTSINIRFLKIPV